MERKERQGKHPKIWYTRDTQKKGIHGYEEEKIEGLTHWQCLRAANTSFTERKVSETK